MEQRDREAVTGPKLLAFIGGAGVFFALLFWSEPGFVFLVDHANLLFHEAGHPLVGLFSRRLEPYGGTLGQLVFPLILVVCFWRKGQAVSLAGAAIWFFENGLNIARYMGDARRLQLPLVGGGDHDWNTIFTRWHVLQYDVQIAAAVKIISWLGMLAACGWLLWRAGRDHHTRRRQSDSTLSYRRGCVGLG